MRNHSLILNIAAMALALGMASCADGNRHDLGFGVHAEQDPDNTPGLLALSYGDSLISGYDYSRIVFTDSIKNIVFPYKSADRHHSGSHGYAIVDLKTRKYIYKEDAYFPIDSIISVDRFNYKLYNREGRHFSTLKLTETAIDEYTVELIPFFSSAAMPVSEFISIGEAVSEKPHDGCLKEMMDLNPAAYRLLEHILNMWGEECSPANDLNFAKAMRHFILKEYNGNQKTAIAEVESILEIPGAVNIQDMTFCMSLSRCMANMQLSWEYEQMILDYPLYEAEYTAWHNLVSALSCYMDFLLENTDWYQCKYMDHEETLMDIFSERQDQLKRERLVLNGKAGSVVAADNMKTAADIDSILNQYHSAEASGYYHPMWNEIRPAIKKWIQTREQIAMSSAPETAESLNSINLEFIDRLYHRIESIDLWKMHPVR
ncbi:MAG: hypothetical protein K2L80_08365 [Muribaculaceae bacterium]|nr:hypothetical protein [Muribaculaceae bacterium]MDE6332601.1 hypothetical protein [Muribaculaceae bacterium]